MENGEDMINEGGPVPAPAPVECDCGAPMCGKSAWDPAWGELQMIGDNSVESQAAALDSLDRLNAVAMEAVPELPSGLGVNQDGTLRCNGVCAIEGCLEDDDETIQKLTMERNGLLKDMGLTPWGDLSAEEIMDQIRELRGRRASGGGGCGSGGCSGCSCGA